MIHINKDLIELIVGKAKQSSRKRMNYNFHSSLDDTFQRMLNCLEPETYCQPHKHENPNKREVFIILTGLAAIVEFDDTGNIIDSIILDSRKGQYGVEIPSATWHTIIALETGTVVYECKDGPYSPINDKNFAPWAPEEGSNEAQKYNETLCKKLGINL